MTHSYGRILVTRTCRLIAGLKAYRANLLGSEIVCISDPDLVQQVFEGDPHRHRDRGIGSRGLCYVFVIHFIETGDFTMGFPAILQYRASIEPPDPMVTTRFTKDFANAPLGGDLLEQLPCHGGEKSGA